MPHPATSHDPGPLPRLGPVGMPPRHAVSVGPVGVFGDGAPAHVAASAMHADGAPTRPLPAGPGGGAGDRAGPGGPGPVGRPDPTPGSPMPEPHNPMPAPVWRIVEGLRGLSTRTALWLRYLGYLLAVVAGAAVTQWAMTGSMWRNGGWFMFYASVLMAVTGVVGTWFYTNHRNEILEQFKHYLFGIMLVPGTALALLFRASGSLFASPAAQGDAFLATTANALPILMFATIVIPAALFVKVVAGLRNLHRSRLDDQEAMQTYARMDPWMR